MLTANKARELIDATMDEYACKANEEVQKVLPQIENQIAEACKKTATSTTVNLTYPKDHDPILRRVILAKLINLLRNEYGYHVNWEDTVTEKSSWWKKKDEKIIDKIGIAWR